MLDASMTFVFTITMLLIIIIGAKIGWMYRKGSIIPVILAQILLVGVAIIFLNVLFVASCG